MIEMRQKLLRRDNPSLKEEDAKKLAGNQLQNELGLVETLSCRGCHYGSQSAARGSPSRSAQEPGDALLTKGGPFSSHALRLGEPRAADSATAQLGGRLGSPRPVHKGMPQIHFEKLTCTACHAGPFPTDQPQIVHTSLAHKLGLPAPAR